MGYQIALDDFGSGFNTLSSLLHLPINKIKLDRGFVTGLPYDEKSIAIFESVILLCNRLKLSLVVEGIENNLQHLFLKEHHCHYGQGFFYSKPLTAKQFITFIQKNNTNLN